MDNTLEKLVPQPVVVQVAGETLSIYPVKFGKLPALIKAAKPIIDHLYQADVTTALLEHPEAVIDVIVTLSGQPRPWVEGLDLDDVVELGGACVEANTDFFVRAVLPKLQHTVQNVTSKIGSTLLNDLSVPGMATPT